MKYLMIVVFSLFLSSYANASLKLSAQGNMYDKGNNTRPQIGLSWYQPLMKNIAVNSYIGGGVEPFEIKEDVMWGAVKTQLDYSFKQWTVSPGIAYKAIADFGDRSYFYVRADYRLF